jgi:hypothetical protein
VKPENFYLGTHIPSWLAKSTVPLFVSRNTLAPLLEPKKRGTGNRLPLAAVRWSLDSGGFTELQLHGKWRITAQQYAAQVRQIRDAVGMMDWAAPQDWMCEPQVIRGLVRKKRGERKDSIDVKRWLEWAKSAGPVMADSVRVAEELGDLAEVVFHGTGLSVNEHQRKTLQNFLELRTIAPDLPWIPVLQGWSLTDYWRHIDMYAAAGVDLTLKRIVGVGSVCRRQGTAIAEIIFRSIAHHGDGRVIRLHGFGVKSDGLAKFGDVLVSADSLAWSYTARRSAPLPGHDLRGDGRRTGHKNCANCYDYAIRWRESLVSRIR